MSRRDEACKLIESTEVLPAQTARLAALLSDPSSENEDIYQAISFDAGITAGVLKAANSVLSGSRVEITSVDQAYRRLGASRVLGLVLGHHAPALAAPVAGYLLPSGELWKRNVATAIAAGELASTLEVETSADPFTAGLLCDVGKIALAPLVEQYADEIHAALDEGHAHDDAEASVLGIDHAEAGALLLQRWDLPESLVTAVRWHHHPDQAPESERPTTSVLHLAEHIAMVAGLGCGTDGLCYEASQEVIERLGVKIDVIESVLCSTLVKMEEARSLLGIEPEIA